MVRNCLSLSLSLLLTFPALASAALPGSSGALYAGWSVEEFALREIPDSTGAQRLPDGLLNRVRSGLAFHGTGGFLGRDLPDFTARRLEDDVKRIRLLLAREGFPSSTVTPVFDANPEKHSVALVLEVDSGPRTRLEDLVIRGLPESLHAAGDSLSEAERTDNRYSDGRVQEISAAIAELLQTSGYAKVQVESIASRSSPEGVTVTFDVIPGDRYRISRVRVGGVPADLEKLIENRLQGVTGQPYSPVALDRVRTDLRELEVLRSVQLSTEPIAEAELELRAQLSTRAYRETSASVGTWTDHSAQVRASWRHRNLFRAGRGFSLGGSWAPNQWEAETTAWWPWFPVASSRSQLRMAYEEQREDAYRSRKAELGLVLSLRSGWSSRWLFDATVARVDVQDLSAARDAFDEGAGSLATIGAGWQSDRTNDLLDPSRGVRLKVHAEGFPAGTFSDFPFASVEQAEVSVYVPLAGPVVLAARLGAGVATPLGDEERLLPEKRFFAGGNSSMRGYGRRALGPTDADGQPLGGQAKILAGAELRMRFSSWFGMPLFADGGQVWAHRGDLDLADLEWALGSGVIFYTPVGPVRVDTAYNVSGTSDERDDWSFHFSIGHAY